MKPQQSAKLEKGYRISEMEDATLPAVVIYRPIHFRRYFQFDMTRRGILISKLNVLQSSHVVTTFLTT